MKFINQRYNPIIFSQLDETNIIKLLNLKIFNTNIFKFNARIWPKLNLITSSLFNKNDDVIKFNSFIDQYFFNIN